MRRGRRGGGEGVEWWRRRGRRGEGIPTTDIIRNLFLMGLIPVLFTGT
jgi:hypothetical protein